MKTYEGSCHCGAIRYQVTMEPPTKAMSCNCSICRRTGALLVFAPRSAFTLVSGEGALGDYQFGKKRIHHQFCRTCGLRPFAHGSDGKGNEMVAINLRCVHDFDLDGLTVEKFDGASI
ncbi:MAG TPA: GFA family protein [Kofleriaceae bacterium]|nr:GFA family protein [Kofleriaceae bacterium]